MASVDGATSETKSRATWACGADSLRTVAADNTITALVENHKLAR